MELNWTHRYMTEDGYTFYVLDDGTVVDNLDPEAVDMSWPSREDFESFMASDEIWWACHPRHAVEQ